MSTDQQQQTNDVAPSVEELEQLARELAAEAKEARRRANEAAGRKQADEYLARTGRASNPGRLA